MPATSGNRPPRPRRRKHPDYDVNVFINCPFDDDYEPLFRALVFTISSCGFIAQCAKGASNQNLRFQRILELVGECRYGLHDLSRIDVGVLPRNNMPLELGVFIGCQRFGAPFDYEKEYLILDSDAHRYNQHTSDVKADDAEYHHDHPEEVIERVRNWLANRPFRDRSQPIPGADWLLERYARFTNEAPALCDDLFLTFGKLSFEEFRAVTTDWVARQQAILKDARKNLLNPKLPGTA